MNTDPLPAPLTPDTAFVVQVRKGSERNRDALQGRVEHVLSGSSHSFASLDELAAFIQRTLADHNGDHS